MVVNDIDRGEAEKVVAEIAAAGGKAVASDDDIGAREGARALVQRCVDEFGAIHALVNNAGNVRDRSFLKMSDDEFDAVLRVHVRGTFLCSQEAALRMKEQGSGRLDREHGLGRALRELRPDQLRRLEGRDRLDDLHLGRRARALAASA